MGVGGGSVGVCCVCGVGSEKVKGESGSGLGLGCSVPNIVQFRSSVINGVMKLILCRVWNSDSLKKATITNS